MFKKDLLAHNLIAWDLFSKFLFYNGSDHQSRCSLNKAWQSSKPTKRIKLYLTKLQHIIPFSPFPSSAFPHSKGIYGDTKANSFASGNLNSIHNRRDDTKCLIYWGLELERIMGKGGNLSTASSVSIGSDRRIGSWRTGFVSSSAGLKRGFCSLFTSPLSVALLFLIEISVAFIFSSLKLAYLSSARDCRNRVVHSIQYSQLRN